jgi:hypothetical protein
MEVKLSFVGTRMEECKQEQPTALCPTSNRSTIIFACNSDLMYFSFL